MHKGELFFSFVLFVVQGFYAFCDSLLRGDGDMSRRDPLPAKAVQLFGQWAAFNG